MAAERPAWWLMSARFLARSLQLRASTHLFALLAVTVGAAVAASMLTLRADLGAKMTRELRRYGPNLILTPAPDREPPLLDEAAVRAVGGLAPSPLLLAGATLRGAASRSDAPCAVIGAEAEAAAHQNPSWQVEGGWPRGEAVLLGRALATRVGAGTGDAVTLALGSAGPSGPRALRLTVSGVLTTGEAEDDQAFVPLPLLQAATGQAGRVSLATYAVDGGLAAVERAARRLEEEIPGAAARPLHAVAAAQGAILARLEKMMLALTLLVLVLSGLGLATTLMGMVVEREPEIALFRALGAGDGDVTRMVLGEVTLLGLLGAGLGFGLGALGARLVGMRLFGAAIEPRFAIAPWVAALALLVAWSAAIVPLRRALAIRPATALRGE